MIVMPKLEETVQVLQELINDLQPAKNDRRRRKRALSFRSSMKFNIDRKWWILVAVAQGRLCPLWIPVL
jgi:hypothetical protein